MRQKNELMRLDKPKNQNEISLTPKILFLTLRIFSATGGIEQVCRVAGKALYELGLQYGGSVKILSMHCSKDAADGNRYFPQTVFNGFNNNKPDFSLPAP